MIPHFHIPNLRVTQTKRQKAISLSRLRATAVIRSKKYGTSSSSSSIGERGYRHKRISIDHPQGLLGYGDEWIEEIIENIFRTPAEAIFYDEEKPEYRNLLWSLMPEGDSDRISEQNGWESLICWGNPDLELGLLGLIDILNEDGGVYEMEIFTIESMVYPSKVKLTPRVAKIMAQEMEQMEHRWWNSESESDEYFENLQVIEWNSKWFLILPEEYQKSIGYTGVRIAALIGTQLFNAFTFVLDDAGRQTKTTPIYGLKLVISYDTEMIWSVSTTEWMKNEIDHHDCFPLFYQQTTDLLDISLSIGDLEALDGHLIIGEAEYQITKRSDFWNLPDFQTQIEEMRFTPKQDPKLIFVLEDLVKKGILERVP